MLPSEMMELQHVLYARETRSLTSQHSLTETDKSFAVQRNRGNSRYSA